MYDPKIIIPKQIKSEKNNKAGEMLYNENIFPCNIM